MGKIEHSTKAVPAYVADCIRAAVARGDYASEEDLVRDVLCDWALHDGIGDRSAAEWKALIEEGLKGPFYDAEAVFAELRARYAPGKAVNG